MSNERVKSLFPRLSSLLTILTLLVTPAFIGTAPQTKTPRPAAQQEERQLPELASQEIDPEVFRIRVPKACEKIRPDVQTHDMSDNFNPPGSPITLSPALAAYANTVGRPTKGYDDKRIDTWFYDSFKLRSCRVCYATLEIKLKHEPELPSEETGTGNQTGKTVALTAFHNDNITVGGAP